MSQFNHLNDPKKHKISCESCKKYFSYSIDDISMYGGHESEAILCPWCGFQAGVAHGGDSLMVHTTKLSN